MWCDDKAAQCQNAVASHALDRHALVAVVDALIHLIQPVGDL
jgi:hypothetical protein